MVLETIGQERKVTCPFSIWRNRERRGACLLFANTSFPCGRTCGLLLVRDIISFEYYFASMTPLSLPVLFIMF